MNLLGVEQVDSGRRSLLPEELFDRIVRVEGEGTFWQKEALINIGLGALPHDCDKVYWSDGDLVIWDDSWLSKSNQLLETYKVIQPFTFAISHARTRRFRIFPKHFGVIKPSYVFLAHACEKDPFLLNLSSPFEKAAPGYIWGARRSLLEALPMYPKAIVGGGDALFALSLKAGESSTLFGTEHRYYGEGAKNYSAKLFELVDGSYTYLDGVVSHLYHADLDYRGYKERQSIFDLEDFDPDRDLEVLSSGLVGWSKERKLIQAAIREYRALREKH
jgi:hypothetical protein